MMRTVCLWLFAMCLLAVPATVRAQGAPPDVGQTIGLGVQRFKEGKFEEALRLYQSAKPLAPDRRMQLQFAIARCLEQLGRTAEAIAAYKEFLGYPDVPEENWRKAQAALAELQKAPLGGRLVLHVTPPQAEVLIDSKPTGVAPLTAPLDLPPGKHELQVRAPGHVAQKRPIEIPSGAPLEVTIALSPQPVVPKEQTSLNTLTASPTHRRFFPWTWVTLSTGAALAVAGSVCFALGEADHRKILDTQGYESGDAVQMTRKRALALQASGDTKKTVGYAFWGVGGAALLSSAALFIVEAATQSPKQPAAIGLAPLPDGLSLSVQGRF